MCFGRLKLFCCLITVVNFAQTLPADELITLDSQIEQVIKGSNTPSLAAAAVVDGKIVAAGAWGIRKKGSPEKVTVQDKYHIGSCTKSMTATLAALLIKDGEISWDTAVSDVFTDLEIHPECRSITLHQLLTNTGGMPSDVEPGLWAELWEAEGTSTEQRLILVRATLTDSPEYEPGTKNVYSNTGFAIAGAMLEKTMGESYEDLLRELLFKPLGMDSAGFRAPGTNNKVDQPYGHEAKLFFTSAVDPEPTGDNPRATAPAGAVHCNIIDLAKYTQLHLGAIGSDLLTAEERAVLHQPTDIDDYAMGWIVTERRWAASPDAERKKGVALTHTGSNTAWFTVIWIAPERNFAAVASANSGSNQAFLHCDAIIGKIIDKFLQD
jgi:CubicO group peptidase (beta-lactamase class C family)